MSHDTLSQRLASLENRYSEQSYLIRLMQFHVKVEEATGIDPNGVRAFGFSPRDGSNPKLSQTHANFVVDKKGEKHYFALTRLPESTNRTIHDDETN